jgi:mono/diheme cytochrome c family protein
VRPAGATLLAALLLGLAAAPLRAGEVRLRFSRDGAAVGSLTREEIESCCEPRVVQLEDPYYGVHKRFLAVPLARVLAQGFGSQLAATLPEADILLRARDGYTRTASGALLLQDGGFLALGDADRKDGGFDPIDRRQVDPAPFYVVWTGAEQRDSARYPWPYQLVEIEIASFARTFPHVVPDGAPATSPARAGFEIFRRECIACHAINGEGGRVGPDLNVPRSIVEYRPKEQIEAFVRNPSSFRYTSMPAHEHLAQADLDALIAYFEFMSAHKHDPGGHP